MNKVETAVRIRHIPSGISVKCQEERSQLMNRNKAMEMLKAKLSVIALEQKARELSEIRGEAVKVRRWTIDRTQVLADYSDFIPD